MRFNIFKNSRVDAQVGYLLDTYDDALRKKTEQYWRTTIANEVFNSCPYITKDNPYACEECYEYYEFIISKVGPSHG